MSDPVNNRFARFFGESREALRRYVRRLVRSRETADEIVQEAFLRTYEQRDTLRIPRAFLFSTARNLAADQRRHERMAATDPAASFDDPGFTDTQVSHPPDEQLIADEESRILKEAVERLPPQCQAAFTLKVLHGCSYKEIAARLGLSPRTVEKHVALGLSRTHVYLRARYSEWRVERAGDTHG
jgi:RNA polymerase sigma factor (sigma-70 family)